MWRGPIPSGSVLDGTRGGSSSYLNVYIIIVKKRNWAHLSKRRFYTDDLFPDCGFVPKVVATGEHTYL